MSALVICVHCGETSCDCEPLTRVEVPPSSRLAEVVALAALSRDPVFRSAVRAAAWVTRGRGVA